jgi:hypothetical protein
MQAKTLSSDLPVSQASRRLADPLVDLNGYSSQSASSMSRGGSSRIFNSEKKKEKKKKSQVVFVGIAERGGRTRSLKIKSLTLYRLS